MGDPFKPTLGFNFFDCDYESINKKYKNRVVKYVNWCMRNRNLESELINNIQLRIREENEKEIYEIINDAYNGDKSKFIDNRYYGNNNGSLDDETKFNCILDYYQWRYVSGQEDVDSESNLSFKNNCQLGHYDENYAMHILRISIDELYGLFYLKSKKYEDNHQIDQYIMTHLKEFYLNQKECIIFLGNPDWFNDGFIDVNNKSIQVQFIKYIVFESKEETNEIENFLQKNIHENITIIKTENFHLIEFPYEKIRL